MVLTQRSKVVADTRPKKGRFYWVVLDKETEVCHEVPQCRAMRPLTRTQKATGEFCRTRGLRICKRCVGCK